MWVRIPPPAPISMEKKMGNIFIVVDDIRMYVSGVSAKGICTTYNCKDAPNYNISEFYSKIDWENAVFLDPEGKEVEAREVCTTC